MDSGATMSAPDPGDSDLMNVLVRMVVPMRREFGRQLDVRHFLHDQAYAHEVLQQALTSQDARLLQYANYVQGRFQRGPRGASNAAPGPATHTTQAAAADQPAASPPAAPAPAGEVERPLGATAEELRQRMLRKYTSGLR
jgi:hypothetical protein